MRVFLSFFILCLCHAGSRAQTFTGTGGTIPGTSTSQTCFTRNVTGVGTINGSYGLASVCINITHPNDDELEIVLTAPDGTVIPLSIQNGGSGNNYTNTCFTATATNPIKFGTAPFNGTYLPEGYLGAVNNGQNANGNWRLCIQDRRTAGNNGSLVNWSLTFNNNPAPLPPALPSCTNTLPSTSSCSTAALVCDFNGQCGSTSGTTVQDWAGSGLDGPCFGLQNNSFIRFIASASTASFSVWVPTTNNTASYNQGGIQMLFFSGTCNSGAVTTYGCYPHILPYSGTGQPLITVVTAQGLTPGNTYYLMIDGFNNDNCNFTIAATTGVNVLNISPAAAAICNGSSVNLTATGGNGVYSWSPAAGLNTSTGATVAASPTANTTYTVTSTTPAGCPVTKDVLVTVNPLPAAATASITAQPTCSAPSGTITISAPLGAGFEYSVNGTAYQTSPVFTGLTPNITYHITVRNISTGCISPEITLTIGPPAPNPVAPTASATAQPTCTIPTGTITVTAPTGPGLLYSIGGPYQASPIFTGLTQNVYNVTVQNGPGCTSQGTSVTINAVPTAVTPTGTVTLQAGCSFPFGRFVFSTPAGTQWEYSINGTTYQSSTVFDNIPPGMYNATVRDINTGCLSASFPFTINAVPNAPPAPVVTVSSPHCGSNGSITVTNPLGTDFEYSINNSPFQSSPVFSGLSGIPGDYEIRVRSISADCISAITTVTLAPDPVPPAFIATFTCPLPPTPGAGEIRFINPVGPAYEYSIDGINFQASPVFPSVPWGTYPAVTYRVIATGCAATAQTLSLAGLSGPITYTVGQPQTCSGGTVTITAPLGNQYQYQLLAAGGGVGIGWQISPLFTNVQPGTYVVALGTISSQCMLLSPTSIVINALPVQAAPPNIGTVHPTCAAASGTIIITPPAGSGLEYSINGTFYQASPTFNNVAPGNYTITVRNTVTGCVSSGTTTTVNPPPVLPSAPTGSVTSLPDCNNSGGTITLTSPLGPDYEYSSNAGTSYQSSPVFTNLPPLSYGITVRNTVSGCISQPLMLTVAAGPVRPEPPTLTTIQPDCAGNPGSITVTAPLGGGLQYSMNGSPYQSSTTFSNLTEALYLVKVKDATGCESFATPAIILQSAGIPSKPVIVQVQPVCPQLTGSITVTSPVAGNIEYSLNGSGYQSSNIFTNVAGGNYNVTARFTGTPCVSASTAANIKGLTPDQCLAPANGDIYFPSAFTPNGDMLNDGFGPGPRSNLSAVSNYTLMIFNRYGELVFKTTDPLMQWDGKFKGKMLANYSYTWVASYRYGTRPLVMKKGTVSVIR